MNQQVPEYNWEHRSQLTLAEKLSRLDLGLLASAILLAGIGVALLFSAAGGSLQPWALSHLVRFFLFLVVTVIIGLVDIRHWYRFAYLFYFAGIALLLLVAVVGIQRGGATRWLDLGFIQIQPSELMKVGMALALARYLNSLEMKSLGNPLELLTPVAIIALPAAIIMLQPDLGTAVIFGLIGLVFFFLAGVRVWLFFALLLAAVLAAPFFWLTLEDYQKARIFTFLNPQSDPQGTGYHILQSMIAFGSGGATGKGYLRGTQAQLNFLPEAQTDFILSLLAEEWGFVGGIILIAAYALLLALGLVIALGARSHFSRLLGLGLVANLFLYLAINNAMVMGLLPVVGVPIPLISHGGSAMLAAMISLGLLLSIKIHKEARSTRRGFES